MDRSKHKKQADGYIAASAAGVIAAFVLEFVFLLIWAKCVDMGRVALKSNGLITFAIHFVSALIGMLITSVMIRDHKARVVIIDVSAIFALQLCIAFIFYDGIKLRSLNHLIAVICAGAIAALVQYSRGKRKKIQNKAKIKYRHCAYYTSR